MARFAAFFLVVMFALPARADLPWYEGGTLQKATAAEWLKAAPENRLATMGDFVAALNSIPDLSQVHDEAKLQALRKQADELMGCVTGSAQRGGKPDRAVAELIVLCAMDKSAN